MSVTLGVRRAEDAAVLRDPAEVDHRRLRSEAALESPRPMSATATSATAAAIAMPNASTTVRPDGRLLARGFMAAIACEVCPFACRKVVCGYTAPYTPEPMVIPRTGE